MPSQYSYCGGMKPKIFAKREQTRVYQRGEDFSSYEREQKSSSFVRRFFFARTRTKIFAIRSKKFSSREQKSSSFEEIFFARTRTKIFVIRSKKIDWRRKLVNTNAIRMRRFFFVRRALYRPPGVVANKIIIICEA